MPFFYFFSRPLVMKVMAGALAAIFDDEVILGIKLTHVEATDGKS